MPAPLTPADLRRLRAALTAADVDAPAVEEAITTAEAHLDRIRSQVADLDASAARRRHVRAFALGEISYEEGVALDAALPVEGEAKGRAQRYARDAREDVLALATRDLRHVGPDLFAHLADVDRDLVAEVAKLAPAVDGIDSDEGAMKAPAKARAAWGNLVDLVAKRSALADVASVLRACGAVTGLDRETPGEYLALAHPDARPVRIGMLHEVRKLIALLDAGAGPGLYSSEQASAFAEADAANLRAVEAGHPSTVPSGDAA